MGRNQVACLLEDILERTLVPFRDMVASEGKAMEHTKDQDKLAAKDRPVEDMDKVVEGRLMGKLEALNNQASSLVICELEA